MKIAVYCKQSNQHNKENIVEELIKNGFKIDEVNPDVILSVGGDGTFLRAVNHYIDIIDNVKIIGINFGTLGFYNEYQRDELHLVIDTLKSGEYKIFSHRLLLGTAIYEDEIKKFYAVNEIRLENPFRTLTCEVFINDESLEIFRGNGLVVSSALGSSAYNKSLGGALVEARFDTIQLTEIAPIENNVYRSIGSSLIIKDDSEIVFKGKFIEEVIGYDSHYVHEGVLLELRTILSDKKVNIIRRKDHSFVKLLRKTFVK
jgi:NAD+ kinase